MLDTTLPIALTDDHGILWVDNGDGTVTNTQDENDGRPDQPWDAVDPRSAEQLHTYWCRNLELTVLCGGGQECVETESLIVLIGASA